MNRVAIYYINVAQAPYDCKRAECSQRKKYMVTKDSKECATKSN